MNAFIITFCNSVRIVKLSKLGSAQQAVSMNKLTIDLYQQKNIFE